MPVLPKPEVGPVPELKNPEDGVVLVLPKPGAAGISTNVMSIGPMPLSMVIGMTVSGPPISAVTVGTTAVMAGMEIVLKVMLRYDEPRRLTVIGLIVNGLTTISAIPRLRGILTGIAKSRLSGENSGMWIPAWKPYSPW